MNAQNKLIELKDICDKAFKRDSIYPLMEIPKPDIKDTIEEELNDLYNKAENAKKEMQEEIVSEWISDVYVRIEASKRYGNKKNKNEESDNEYKEMIKSKIEEYNSMMREKIKEIENTRKAAQ